MNEELNRVEPANKIVEAAVMTLDILSQTGGEYYLWGSAGRSVALHAHQNRTKTVYSDGLRSAFPKDREQYDLDISFPVGGLVSWDYVCNIAGEIYGATQQKIIVDPHFMLIDKGIFYSNPNMTRRSYAFPLENLIRIELPNGNIYCPDINTQLSFLRRPDLPLTGKYLRYYNDILASNPDIRTRQPGNIDPIIYELILRRKTLDSERKGISKTFYHMLLPAHIRGEIARLRRIMMPSVKSIRPFKNSESSLSSVSVNNFELRRPLYI